MLSIGSPHRERPWSILSDTYGLTNLRWVGWEVGGPHSLTLAAGLLQTCHRLLRQIEPRPVGYRLDLMPRPVRNRLELMFRKCQGLPHALASLEEERHVLVAAVARTPGIPRAAKDAKART